MGLTSGFIGQLLQFVRTERNGAKFSQSQVDQTSGAAVTAEHFQSAGEDTNPLPGDYVALIPIRRQGGFAAVGYIDPINAQTAAPGERRFYGRNADGAIVCTVWLKSTGEIAIANGSGSFVMQPDGDVVINGVIIKQNGDIETSAKITSTSTIQGVTVKQSSNNVTLGTHNHPSNGSPPTTGT